MAFGTLGDATIFRDQASTLRTAASFFVGGLTLVGNRDVYVGYADLGNKLLFGSAGDTNLYRASAGLLRTDGGLDVLGTLTAPNVATRLAEVVLGSAAASINVTSIPATYRHLRLVVTARGDAAANNVQLLLRLNGDAGANYAYQTVQANDLTISGGRSVGQTSFALALVPGATAGANLFATTTITLGCYKATDKTKEIAAFGTSYSSTANPQFYSSQGNYAGTAALTALNVVPASGNLVAGTTVTLYGEP